jgi:hypothetical protein
VKNEVPPITQGDPAPTTLFLNQPYTITLAPATGVPADEITYQWQSSSDNTNWTNITDDGTSADYTILANTFRSSTYFRRRATAQGFTITSASALISLDIPGNLPEYVTIGNTTWVTRNVDLSTSTGFTSRPADAGMLFKWSRLYGWRSDGADGNRPVDRWNPFLNGGAGGWENTTWVWEEDEDFDEDNDPCRLISSRNPGGSSYRMPILEEVQALGEGTWVTSSQVVAAGLGNSAGSFFGTPPNMIFLPAAGSRNTMDGGSFWNAGERGYYWTSSTPPVGSTAARMLFFWNGHTDTGNSSRGNAESIRCVKE